MATKRSSFQNLEAAQKAPWYRRFGLGQDETKIDHAYSNNFTRKIAKADDTNDVDVYQVDTDNSLLIGGEAISPMRMTETFYLAAPSATPNQTIFVAPYACKITGISCQFETANAAALTAQIRHEKNTQALATGSVVQTNSFNLNGTVNVVQNAALPTLIANSGAIQQSVISLAVGERLSIKFSTSITSLAGLAITVYFTPAAKGHVAFYRMSANGSIATQTFFLANRPSTVQKIQAIWGTKATNGGTVTVDVTKDTSTNAAGAGVSLLAAALSVKTAINTVNTPALTATASRLLFAAGDRLAVKFTGTLTALADIVVAVWFLPTYDRKEVSFTMNANAGLVTQPFFVADIDYEIVDFSEIHGTLGTDGGAVTVALEIDGGVTAAGSGLIAQTDNSSAGFSLKATTNTVQLPTLAALSKRLLPAGGRLALKFAGVTTAVAGVTITVSMRPRS